MNRALFIIDVQNDFTEGGALGVNGGAAVAQAISEYLRDHAGEYSVILASRDWHAAENDNGGHFAREGEQPDFVVTWPRHCVAGTPGADYHPALDTSRVTYHIRKGQGVPAYSIFEGRTEAGSSVHNILDEHAIDSIDVVGIATDYCVRASALDALSHGQKVRILTDLIAGVAPTSSAAALEELRSRGAQLASSSSAPAT